MSTMAKEQKRAAIKQLLGAMRDVESRDDETLEELMRLLSFMLPQIGGRSDMHISAAEGMVDNEQAYIFTLVVKPNSKTKISDVFATALAEWLTGLIGLSKGERDTAAYCFKELIDTVLVAKAIIGSK